MADTADYRFGAEGDSDDLPRTLRREREARQREARQRDELDQHQEYGLLEAEQRAEPDELFPATVKRLDIPFTQLVLFFLKAVLAAIPAIIVLGVILWLFGHMLQMYFPQLIKMQILIRFPG